MNKTKNHVLLKRLTHRRKKTENVLFEFILFIYFEKIQIFFNQHMNILAEFKRTSKLSFFTKGKKMDLLNGTKDENIFLLMKD